MRNNALKTATRCGGEVMSKILPHPTGGVNDQDPNLLSTKFITSPHHAVTFCSNPDPILLCVKPHIASGVEEVGHGPIAGVLRHNCA